MMKNCYDCNLCLYRKTIVNGQGVKPSPVMIIGEAPGAREDKLAIPFVGNAGMLLNRELNSYNLFRDTNIYVTNAVKCKPIDNRTPTVNEILKCRKYLIKEIQECNPKFILLLGNTALSIINKNGIHKHRGKIYKAGNILFISTYHPAYIIRNKKDVSLYKEFKEDISTLYWMYREEYIL